MSDKKRRHIAMTRPDASWRRMLVSQPPPRKIGRVKEWGRDQICRHWNRKIVVMGDGLRMGDLYDVFDACLWRRFVGQERHKKLPRAYRTALWIGWKMGIDEEMERLGINPTGCGWMYAGQGAQEMPQPHKKGDQWVEEEKIDLVIGELDDGALPRCRGHNGMGPWTWHVSRQECCEEGRIPGFAANEKWKPDSPYARGSSRWFECQGRNEEVIEQLTMEEVGEPEGLWPNSTIRDYRWY